MSSDLRHKWRYMTQKEKDELRTVNYDSDEEDLDEDEFAERTQSQSDSEKIDWANIQNARGIVFLEKCTLQEWAQILHEAFPKS